MLNIIVTAVNESDISIQWMQPDVGNSVTIVSYKLSWTTTTMSNVTMVTKVPTDMTADFSVALPGEEVMLSVEVTANDTMGDQAMFITNKTLTASRFKPLCFFPVAMNRD